MVNSRLVFSLTLIALLSLGSLSQSQAIPCDATKGFVESAEFPGRCICDTNSNYIEDPAKPGTCVKNTESRILQAASCSSGYFSKPSGTTSTCS